MKPDTVLLACSHKNVVPPLTFGKRTNWNLLTFFRRSFTQADQNTTATRTGCHEDVRKGSNRYETRHDQSQVIDPGRHEILNRDRNDACVALLGDRNGHGDGKPKQPPARRVTRAPHSPYQTFLPGWVTAGALAASALLFPATAHGQSLQQCAKREVVIASLAQKYGETRRAIGLGKNNAVMEVYASAESGSWTVIMTTPRSAPDGTLLNITCLVASGQAFEAITEALPPKGDQL